MESTTSLPILFIFSYNSTTGVFTVPPGGDGVYYFSILFISRYDSTTGVFTVPPGGDGVYYFSMFVMVQTGEHALLDITLNDDIICTTWPDQDATGDPSTGSCSAVIDAVAGKDCSFSVQHFRHSPYYLIS